MESDGEATGSKPKMRRAPAGRLEDLAEFELFLDDVIDIEKAFLATGMGTLKIRADDYEFDHAEDLPELKQSEVHDLKLELVPMYASFEVRKYLGRMYVYDMNDLKLVGLLTTVRSIANKRKRRKGSHWVVSLRGSTDPGPPSWRERNRDLTVAIVGAIVGALATALLTAALFVLGILKAA